MLMFMNLRIINSFNLLYLMYHLTVKRQMGRFAGFSLYVSNSTDIPSGFLCYKDGPELPPLDFDINCIANGRYVIFYNERKDRQMYPVGYETSNVITELCEIIVTGSLYDYNLVSKYIQFKIRIYFFMSN